MKHRVYIETSVVSYYVGQSSHDLVLAGRQQVTKDFWLLLGSQLEGYVSALVVKEAGKGDNVLAKSRLDAVQPFSVLKTTNEAERLARKIIEGRGIPEKYPEDALHIGIAAAAGIEFIATWNFSHINNPFTKMMIRHIIENDGYDCPEIVTPDVFIGG